MLDEEICLLLKQISSLEIVAVLLLLLLPLLAVDLKVETSRMPLLQMHTSPNTSHPRSGDKIDRFTR